MVNFTSASVELDLPGKEEEKCPDKCQLFRHEVMVCYSLVYRLPLSITKTSYSLLYYSCACAFILVTYYSMLISWVVKAFFQSFSDDAPWADPDVTPGEASGYFFNEIIGMETLGADLRPTRIVGSNVGYAALTYLAIFLCIAFGIESVGRITYFTMGFPIVLLFTFLIKVSRWVAIQKLSNFKRASLGCVLKVINLTAPFCWFAGLHTRRCRGWNQGIHWYLGLVYPRETG
jgi:hypothetical protein